MPCRLHRPCVAFVAAALLCVTAIAASAAAAPSRSVTAFSARACHNHPGIPEGDGEYSDGAILQADGISCRGALALVKSRYHWIYAHWDRAYYDGFRLHGFRCRMRQEGPDVLKTCVNRHRRFEFV